MPRPPRNKEIARHRVIVLVTAVEQQRFGALAEYLEIPLAELIRQHLEKLIARLEKRGIKLPKKRRARW